MKKLLLVVCVTVSLLFSVDVRPVQADDGDGHDPGYVCIKTETVDCPPADSLPPLQQSEPSGSSTETTEANMPTLLDLIITLILKS